VKPTRQQFGITITQSLFSSQEKFHGHTNHNHPSRQTGRPVFLHSRRPQTNLEREKQFLSTVKEWKRFDVTAKGVGEDVTFYETVMDWVTTDGTPVHVEQVVVAKWQNGKITHERFYHGT
jgi:hypothetical protein